MAAARADEILWTALDMIAVRGFRGTSLNAIADRVGLSRQGVLHYFPSKQHLLDAVLQRTVELGRGDIPATQVREDLPDLLAAVVARNREHPAFAQAYAVLLAESVTPDHPAHAHFRDHYQQVRDQMTHSFTECWGETLPSGLTPLAAATALLALLDGLKQQWLLDRTQVDHPEIIRSVLAVLIGSAPRASR
ncbi:helix-turn-helix domain-containing protein [Nocardia sp. NPDC024068]|uniref:TetR/AcrR family transcriptional regulator n=1 Tax=Nocardia sp. NPDC024068 TaxID=3157197 RepID=UPI0033D7194C